MDAPLTEKPKRLSRGWLAAGVAVIVVLLTVITTVYLVYGWSASEPECEPGAYHKTDFNEKVQIAAVSPNGEYAVGNRVERHGAGRLVLWHDGKTTNIPDAPVSDGISYPTDVNDSGTVVGYSQGSAAGDQSWVYEDGDFRMLQGSDGEKYTTALAMNNDGTIVGGMDIDKADWVWGTTPVKWEPGSTVATRLMDDDVDGEAADIGDDGTIVGSIHPEDPDDSAQTDAWWWTPGGHGEPLMPELTAEDRKKAVSPGGHSTADMISGDWILASGVRVDIADDFAAQEIEGVRPAAIDEHGRVFGRDDKDNVVVYDDKRTILPGLDEPPFVSEEDQEAGLGVGSNAVMAVSRDGSIVFGIAWTDHGVMWTCG